MTIEAIAMLAGGFGLLVIGLTVVAYGTSAPELAVSLKGALYGQADIALGNVVGSNIYNILMIIGTTSLLSQLHGLEKFCVRYQKVGRAREHI